MLLKFPWNSPVIDAAPLRPVSSATGSHSFAARDHFEIESVLDVLSRACPTNLDEQRILEFSCGRPRTPFLLAAAEHRVLAADTDPENLANMAERLVPSTPARADVAARVELRLADMRNFCFPEDFKAIHIPSAGLALFDAAQRCNVLKLAGDHLAPGGLLIISTQEVRRAATSLVGAADSPVVRPVEHTALESRRQPALHWDTDLSIPQSQLIASSWIANACTRLGMTVTFQRSRPDPTYPGHTHVTLAVQHP
ncbi:SAM-dependent methyltransferase [Actinomyces israelii]|uniref:Class I SAM-dependent methyltransferase n=1 Tax=Actinomyces israelii TaxID=1659 RepID=A0ABT4IC21_9ACTO|nr:class I SAM-dependent methyltransferase [Actinomyces israelii]MCZ0859280.1 class I SAM-dependent methyltransferase [Actinomyces israelii]WKR20232.1 hypothetical protein AIF0345_0099 [Actinomyces israelii]